ncbi:MAG: hypothetical protein WCF80_20885, partial [Pseudolabrys sp.]
PLPACIVAATGLIASNEPQRADVATRSRAMLPHVKAPAYRSARRESGSTQLAAVSKKKHQKVRLSQRSDRQEL